MTPADEIVDDRGAVVAVALAPAERLGASRVAEPAVVVAVVEVAQEDARDVGRLELGARHRAVPALVGPALAGEGGVEREQVRAAVGRGRNPSGTPAGAVAPQNAAPHTTTSSSSSTASTRSAANTCTFAGQPASCQAEPGDVGVVVAGRHQHRDGGALELTRQERDRVGGHGGVLVDVAGQDDGVHALGPSGGERTRERIAQAGPAAGRVAAVVGGAEHAVEVGVCEVEDLHAPDPPV